MNFRGTAILFCALLSTLWLFGLVLALKQTSVDERYIMPEFHAAPAVLSELRIDKKVDDAVQSLIFVKAGPGWAMKLPGQETGVKVETFEVERIIRQLRDLKRNDAAAIQHDLKTHGLVPAQMTVTIKGTVTKNKKDIPHEWKFYLGNELPTKNDFFVSSSERSKEVLTVSRGEVDAMLDTSTTRFRPSRLIELNELTVSQLTIKEVSAGKEVVEFKKDSDGLWRFVKPDLGIADGDGPPQKFQNPVDALDEPGGGVKGIIIALDRIRVEPGNFVSLAETDLESFGLADGKEAYSITAGTAEGVGENVKLVEETLLIGNRVGNLYFARRGNDRGIVKLSAKSLEPVLSIVRDPGKLRSPDLTHIVARNVDAVTLQTGKDLKESITLYRPAPKKWQVRATDTKLQKASDQAVATLLDHLEGKRKVAKFYEGTDAKKLDDRLGFLAPRARIQIYSGALETLTEKKDAEPALKKDASPTVSLTFGIELGDKVAVKREREDGLTARFAIPKKLYDEIVPDNGIVAFLDKSLPEYPDDQVVGVTLKSGDTLRQIVPGKGAAGAPWMIQGAGKQSSARGDKKKIDALIRIFTTLDALRWLKKIEPKEDLAKYGLADPKASATIYLRDDTADAKAAVCLLGALAGRGTMLAPAAFLGSTEANIGKPVTVSFGKETGDPGKPGVYARHTGSDYLFVLAAGMPAFFSDIDLRDRSLVQNMQAVLDAAALAGGPAAVIASMPILGQVVQDVAPAAIQEIKLDLRSPTELRRFHFVRAGNAKDAKVKDAKITWTDKSGLLEFTADSSKVQKLVDDFARLKALRIVTLAGSDDPEYKFGTKQATITLEFIRDKGTPVTLTVGASFEEEQFFARTSQWRGVVFLLPRSLIDPILDGTSYFGKQRLARNN